MTHIYIASDSDNGGIHHYLSCGGEMEFKSFYPCDRPAYMAYENGRLYVLLREPLREQSGVIVYIVKPDGSLLCENEIIPLAAV